MPEAFKEKFNIPLVKEMAQHIHRVWPDFNKKAFIKKSVNQLESLELKDRYIHIANVLHEYLPKDFKEAVAILLQSLAPYNQQGPDDTKKGITGWGTLPLNHYVGQNGLDDFTKSMAFLKESTSRFSAEFDIRFFLIHQQQRTVKLLTKWARDKNYHVRRLVSEGTRPRLPWGIQLQSFIEDPAPILPLLEALKDDQEEYVRRSVANNLNDIAKDHPDLVAKIAKAWLVDADANRKKLVRHACRTLIKQGHKKTLTALGYTKPKISIEAWQILNSKVKFGNALVFELTIKSTSTKTQNLIIDYAIHHRKANGSTSPKIFKWKVISLKAKDTLQASKKHAIKKITTRVYYNGAHAIELFVNGDSIGKKAFELVDVK
ncbi:MAG: DNA alkylation repair protein [Pseudomonadota bacterium]